LNDANHNYQGSGMSFNRTVRTSVLPVSCWLVAVSSRKSLDRKWSERWCCRCVDGWRRQWRHVMSNYWRNSLTRVGCGDRLLSALTPGSSLLLSTDRLATR